MLKQAIMLSVLSLALSTVSRADIPIMHPDDGGDTSQTNIHKHLRNKERKEGAVHTKEGFPGVVSCVVGKGCTFKPVTATPSSVEGEVGMATAKDKRSSASTTDKSKSE